MDEIEELKHQLETVIGERNKYHAALTDLRLSGIEIKLNDHELRIRPLEEGHVKSNTIYALFIGNGLLSVIALFKLFS